jgi:hypothetical protein
MKSFQILSFILLACLTAVVNTSGSEKMAKLNGGDILLFQEDEFWRVARFVSYVTVTEVSFFWDERDEVVSGPVTPIPDSAPRMENSTMTLVDLFSRPFSSRADAESWIGSKRKNEGFWVKNVIRDPRKLIKFDSRGFDTKPKQ